MIYEIHMAKMNNLVLHHYEATKLISEYTIYQKDISTKSTPLMSGNHRNHDNRPIHICISIKSCPI